MRNSSTPYLKVWMEHFSEPAGYLYNENDALSFAYSKAYLQPQKNIPLSLSLPLSAGGFGDVVTRDFFKNLLHENNKLDDLLNRKGIDRNDVWEILYHIGGDCPGAISCLPAEAGPVKRPGHLSQDYDELTGEDFSVMLKKLSLGRPPLEEDYDPSPLAGVQNKMAITRLRSGKFALPKKGLKVPTTHIIKVPKVVKSVEVDQEIMAARLAQAVGLEAMIPEAIEYGGIKALLIERFDRVVSKGDAVQRIHQEDFAQALALPPKLKYERHGEGSRIFNAVSVIQMLKKLKEPAKAKREFLKTTFFNYAIGNSDNHAKNHALIYGLNDKPYYAPLYDLLPSRLDNNYTEEFAFRIGSAEAPDHLTAQDVRQFIGLVFPKEKAVERYMDKELRPMLIALEEATLELKHPKFETMNSLIGMGINHLSNILNLNITTRERAPLVRTAAGWAISS